MPTPYEKIRDGLYVKKSFDGYRVVYPYKNDDGSWNWFNIIVGGNWWKLIKVTLLVSLILFSVWAYRRDTQFCQDLEQTICDKLVNITMMCSPVYRSRNFQYPTLNESQLAQLNISKELVIEDE